MYIPLTAKLIGAAIAGNVAVEGAKAAVRHGRNKKHHVELTEEMIQQSDEAVEEMNMRRAMHDAEMKAAFGETDQWKVRQFITEQVYNGASSKDIAEAVAYANASGDYSFSRFR